MRFIFIVDKIFQSNTTSLVKFVKELWFEMVRQATNFGNGGFFFCAMVHKVESDANRKTSCGRKVKTID